MPVLAHLDERAIQPHVRIRSLERARAEALHLPIEFGAQPADLALADAVHAERLHQVVDAARRDALHVRFLDHRDQCLLCASSGLEQAGEEASVPGTRTLELDRADARVPWPLAVAVAIPTPFRRPFVALGANVLGELELHQFLRQHAHTLTQEIRFFHARLAQYLGECHSQFVGHRCWFLSSDLVNRDENHPMAVRVNGPTFTQPWGHYPGERLRLPPRMRGLSS